LLLALVVPQVQMLPQVVRKVAQAHLALLIRQVAAVAQPKALRLVAVVRVVAVTEVRLVLATLHPLHHHKVIMAVLQLVVMRVLAVVVQAL